MPFAPNYHMTALTTTLNSNMMRKIQIKNFLSLLYIAAFMMVISSCKKDDEGTPDTEAQVKEKLVGTWSPSDVSLDANDVSSDFESFTLSIDKDLNYSTNSGQLDRQPNPWPSIGSFTLETTADNTSMFSLTREDGLEIIGTLDGTLLQLDFTFSSENTNSGGRMHAVEGTWVFSLNK